MRNICEVIDNITRAIPTEEYEENRGAFDSLLSSIRCSPPELMYLHWERLQGVLISIIGPTPTEEWHFAALSEFSTMPIEAIKEEVERIRRDEALLKGV